MKYFLAALCGVLGTIWGKMGALGPVLVLLLAASGLDYITGMLAGAKNEGLSSLKGRKGILRKIGNWVGVLTAYLMDLILIYGGPSLGVTTFTFPVLCPAVAVWMALNEILSILENLGEVGVQFPAFLTQFVAQLRGKADSGPEAVKPVN